MYKQVVWSSETCWASIKERRELRPEMTTSWTRHVVAFHLTFCTENWQTGYSCPGSANTISLFWHLFAFESEACMWHTDGQLGQDLWYGLLGLSHSKRGSWPLEECIFSKYVGSSNRSLKQAFSRLELRVQCCSTTGWRSESTLQPAWSISSHWYGSVDLTNGCNWNYAYNYDRQQGKQAEQTHAKKK